MNNYNGVICENHLGGFIYEGDVATTFPQLWKFIVVDKNIKSIIDLGCGRGFSTKFFKEECGCEILGLEGSDIAVKTSLIPEHVTQIDFTKERFVCDKKYDLLYSAEFVEHVEEQYINNYINSFKCCNHILMTYADIGQGGHHHVNCQSSKYWISLIENIGFIFDYNYTQKLKEYAKLDRIKLCSSFDGNHFEHRGLYFKKTI